MIKFILKLKNHYKGNFIINVQLYYVKFLLLFTKKICFNISYLTSSLRQLHMQNEFFILLILSIQFVIINSHNCLHICGVVILDNAIKKAMGSA